jgi:hypothetical protein
MRMPHHHYHHHQTPQIGERARAIGRRVGARLREGRPWQKVFGQVADRAQFRRQNDPRALLVSAPCGREDSTAVSRQIPDRVADPRQGHLDRRKC